MSNAGIPTVKKITDLYAIKKSGFYYYDAGATNAPMSSRGGMIVANYLSDSWISLTVVPYASSKIYTNTKYNNTWVGWAESATKDDLGIYFTADGSKAAVYKQNVISVSIQLKAGYTYFLVGKMVYPFQTMDRCQQRLMYCPMQVAFSILEILAQRCLMAAVV